MTVNTYFSDNRFCLKTATKFKKNPDRIPIRILMLFIASLDSHREKQSVNYW